MVLDVLTIGFDGTDAIDVWCTGNFSRHWIAGGWRDHEDEDLVHIILNGVQLVVRDTDELTKVLADL